MVVNEKVNEVQRYQGSCHCGLVTFTFESPVITNGLRCNCSMCQRRGAVMSTTLFRDQELNIEGQAHLQTYQFGTNVAKYYFCKHCGIHPFHQTVRVPGAYRINLGCVKGIDILSLPYDLFNGRELL